MKLSKKNSVFQCDLHSVFLPKTLETDSGCISTYTCGVIDLELYSNTNERYYVNKLNKLNTYPLVLYYFTSEILAVPNGYCWIVSLF